jgi:hypothetical protein
MPENFDKTHPMGTGDRVVEQGECVSSIAADAHLPWKRIWNDPANSDLKAERKDPNILLPRDRLTIPDVATADFSKPTDASHTFTTVIDPVKLRLRLIAGDVAFSDQPFTLTIAGADAITGTTDSNGLIDVKIPPDAMTGTLQVGTTPHDDFIVLQFGSLNPVEVLTGVQQRLMNLGIDCGPAGDDGIYGHRTQHALLAFQNKMTLEPTGKPDDDTRDALKREHGC